MNQVVLLLGSNLDDRLALLQKAEDAIGQILGKVFQKSAVYESEAWGFESENTFLNQVLVVQSGFAPGDVLQIILEIEKKLGRERISNNGYASRTMDIDILFYNDEVWQLPELEIPHPRLHQRMFTLAPLCEVMPEYVHPVLHKTVQQLMDECTDEVPVSTYKP